MTLLDLTRRYDPVVTDSDEPIRVPVLFQLGWYRWLPLSAMDFEELLHRFPDTDRQEVVWAQRVWNARRAGVELDRTLAPDVLGDSLPSAPAWPDPAGQTGEPGDEQAYQGELLDHQRRVNEYDEVTNRLGIPLVRTAEQVLDLMIMLRLVEVDTTDGKDVLRLAVNPPLPTEVLPLSPEQRAMEDKGRWMSRYGRLSQRVLRLFVDDASGDLSRVTLATSLDRLAAATESDPEDVRHAVQVLVAEGDFSAQRQGAPVDAERLVPHQRFDLVVDPDRFYADRISVQLNRPVERSDY
ncbi:DUF6042 family protein [Micromonospora aurantiaca (nom. illeg.)]|uniref:DUF6042 family protein n=1 Tax=Micromonospora aurantiaca (nom. illeg.) TaxID=47850 RepID=UPI0033C0ECB1